MSKENEALQKKLDELNKELSLTTEQLMTTTKACSDAEDKLDVAVEALEKPTLIGEGFDDLNGHWIIKHNRIALKAINKDKDYD